MTLVGWVVRQEYAIRVEMEKSERERESGGWNVIWGWMEKFRKKSDNYKKSIKDKDPVSFPACVFRIGLSSQQNQTKEIKFFFTTPTRECRP